MKRTFSFHYGMNNNENLPINRNYYNKHSHHVERNVKAFKDINPNKRFGGLQKDGNMPSYFVLKGKQSNAEDVSKKAFWPQHLSKQNGETGDNDTCQETIHAQLNNDSNEIINSASSNTRTDDQDLNSDLEMFKERWNTLAPLCLNDFRNNERQISDVSVYLRIAQLSRALQNTQEALDQAQTTQIKLIEELAETRNEHKNTRITFEKRLNALEANQAINHKDSNLDVNSEKSPALTKSEHKKEESELESVLSERLNAAIAVITQKYTQNMIGANTTALCETMQRKFEEMGNNLDYEKIVTELENHKLSRKCARETKNGHKGNGILPEKMKITSRDKMEEEILFTIDGSDGGGSEDEWPPTVLIAGTNEKDKTSNVLSQSTVTSASTIATSPSQMHKNSSETLPTNNFAVAFKSGRSIF